MVVVKIAVETRKGAVTRHVSITAPTIERALELAGRGVVSCQVLSASDGVGDSYEKAA